MLRWSGLLENCKIRPVLEEIDSKLCNPKPPPSEVEDEAKRLKQVFDDASNAFTTCDTSPMWEWERLARHVIAEKRRAAEEAHRAGAKHAAGMASRLAEMVEARHKEKVDALDHSYSLALQSARRDALLEVLWQFPEQMPGALIECSSARARVERLISAIPAGRQEVASA